MWLRLVHDNAVSNILFISPATFEIQETKKITHVFAKGKLELVSVRIRMTSSILPLSWGSRLPEMAGDPRKAIKPSTGMNAHTLVTLGFVQEYVFRNDRIISIIDLRNGASVKLFQECGVIQNIPPPPPPQRTGFTECSINRSTVGDIWHHTGTPVKKSNFPISETT